MSTFVKVEFNSAKLVYPYYKGAKQTEKVHFPIYKDRPNYFDNPEKVIMFEPISNMLHVLFGRRPSSTFRKSATTRNPRIDEIVRNGYIKIDTVYKYTDKNGRTRLLTEFTQGKANAYNSHSNDFYTKVGDKYIQGECTWKILYEKYYFDNNEKYHDIMNHIYDYSGVKNPQEDYTLTEILLLIADGNKKNDAINYFINNDLTPLADVISGEKKPTFNTFTDFKSKKAAKMLNSRITSKLTLDGEFIFKVTDDEYQELISNGRFATYLDGGVAELIPKRLCLDENDLYKYEPISKYEC